MIFEKGISSCISDIGDMQKNEKQEGESDF